VARRARDAQGGTRRVPRGASAVAARRSNVLFSIREVVLEGAAQAVGTASTAPVQRVW